MIARVLAVAGSDSGGGAGIQADIRAITALGGFAMTAVTAVTAQDTLGVHAIHKVPAAIVAEQIRVVLADLGADAVKCGMLGDAATAQAVAAALGPWPGLPLVLDPVLRATSGDALLAGDGRDVLAPLMGRAVLVTPNLSEAALLCGFAVSDVSDMARAGRALRAMGAAAVLVKGGHLPGNVLTDVLVDAEGVVTFAAERIATRHLHGTGCTLASAIATHLARGRSLREAVAEGRAYLRAAILAAPGLGAGQGPLGTPLPG
jgi:hydroxymethylpyrimidine/phosphomethylpyrimidine kinase